MTNTLPIGKGKTSQTAKERIESIRRREKKLTEERQRLRKLIAPYMATIHKAEEELFALAKERQALQAKAILEEQERKKVEKDIETMVKNAAFLGISERVAREGIAELLERGKGTEG